MRIAILSDVHGNRTALEAVLADLEQQRPDAVQSAERRAVRRIGMLRCQ
jgi:predicted phosphodiesterase